MNISEVTALVIAASGVGGTYTAYRLGQRGQHNDEKQQAAATRLQERISAFDELESLNDRLSKEVDRLRELLGEAETRGDLRLSQQTSRCRERIEELTTAVATLQSVVLSEVASAAAAESVQRAERHVATDHPSDSSDA